MPSTPVKLRYKALQLCQEVLHHVDTIRDSCDALREFWAALVKFPRCLYEFSTRAAACLVVIFLEVRGLSIVPYSNY